MKTLKEIFAMFLLLYLMAASLLEVVFLLTGVFLVDSNNQYNENSLYSYVFHLPVYIISWILLGKIMSRRKSR